MKKYRKVLVQWRDAVTAMGWEDHGAAIAGHEAEPCESVGYVIHRTKTNLVLAQTVSGDGQINGRITIPIDWVNTIQTLKV
jgi:hypothetical protein